jgi:hypothetical protein
MILRLLMVLAIVLLPGGIIFASVAWLVSRARRRKGGRQKEQ